MIQKSLTWLTALIENLLFFGAFFGWANIYPVLQDEGYFNQTCPVRNSTQKGGCESQDESLSLVFSISTSVGSLAGVFLGSILDRFGMWCARTVGIAIAAAAYLVTAISTRHTSSLLYVTFPLIYFTGFGMMLINAQLANFYPSLRALYSTTTVGAFGSASIVYVTINQLYRSGYDFKVIVYVYSGLYLLCNARTFVLTPKRSVPLVLPDDYAYGYKELCGGKAAASEKKIVDNGAGDKTLPEDATTFKDCFRRVFLYTAIFSAGITQFLTIFYISSFNLFFRQMVGDQADVAHYTNLFGIFQACSLLFAPLNGYFVDFMRRRFLRSADPYHASMKSFAVGFATSILCVVVMVICNLLPYVRLQIVAMLMQVVARLSFFGFLNAFVSLAFPHRFFGKVFGVITLTVGLVSMLQYPLTLVLTRHLDKNFTPINLVFLVLAFLSLVHPCYIWYYVSKRLEPKSDSAAQGGHDNPAMSLDDEKNL